jgi:CubicO group peptidase (beta-lactamase class C family)
MPRLILVLILLVPNLTRAAMHFDEDHQKQAADAIGAAIESRQCPGAVLLVGTKDGVRFKQAYGHRAFEPEDQARKPMTVDTLFDLASLSKSIGCATSIMVLADQGKLKVTDPVSKYIRAAATQPDKKEITIEQCLLHRAGFIADNPMSDYENCTHEQMIEHLFARKLKYEPGTDCVYSDLSFIVLGEVVKSASGGEGLDVFARRYIFEPAGMKETSYLPPAAWKDRIAPTEKRGGHWMIGEVHDPRAWALGGFAGHAGVFGTADDVARWCRTLLNGGEIDGKRVLSSEIVTEMTKSRCMPDGKNCRGYGVDFTTAYSPAPRGERFERGTTYGHTGYTGTSYWIDPVHGCFYVFLTNRVNPDDKANVTPLRRKIATIVGEALLGPKSE